jgi:PAS domain S-box-containing protein
VDHSPAVIFVKDTDGRYLLVNRRFEETAAELGISGPFVGKTDAEIVPADVAERFRRDDLEVLADRRARIYEESADIAGESRVWLTTKFPLLNPEGRAYAVCGINLDVTDSRRAELALRLSEARTFAILESISDAFFALDRDWRFTYVNSHAESLLGRAREELIGRDIWEEFAPAVGTDFEHNYRRAVAEGVTTRFETFYPPHERWYEVHAYPSADGLAVYFRDASGRRRLIEELEGERRRLRAVVENAPVGIILAEAPSGRIVLANPQIEAILRHPAFLSENISEYREWVADHPDGRRVQSEEWTLARSLAGEVRPGDDYLYHRGDGTRGWIKVSGAPIRDADGRVVGGVVAVHDIDPEKRLEAALREGEARLRLALTAGRMGVWDWDVRTGVVNWSNDLEAIHGLEPGTFDGTFEGFVRLVHPGDRDGLLRAVTAALEDGTDLDHEFRIVHPDGSIAWMVSKGKVFREGNRAVRMVGIGADITARRRAAEDARFLADASSALAAIVDTASTFRSLARLAVPAFADWCAVDMLDAGGGLRRVAVAHVDPARVELAHDLHRRFPPDPSSPSGVWNIIRTGKSEIVPEVTDAMLEASVKDPELLAALRGLGLRSYMGVPVSVRGRVLGVLTFIAAESGRRYDARDLAVAEDLAARAGVAVQNARLYEELREADRRKDGFLAMLAHELRNPLAAADSALRVLALGGDADRAEWAREATARQVRHLAHMVDELLDVSRLQRGKVRLRPETLDLARLTREAAGDRRPVVEQAGLTLEIDVPEEPVWVRGDPTRLTQVLGNLLANAIKFAGAGSRVRVRLTTDADPDRAVLEVTDNGAGIDADLLLRLFEPFVQGDASLERTRGGLGLGLALVKGLAELHGGSVTAASEGPGCGARFTVHLPLTSPPTELAAERPTTPVGRPLRILLVEDQTDAAQYSVS